MLPDAKVLVLVVLFLNSQASSARRIDGLYLHLTLRGLFPNACEVLDYFLRLFFYCPDVYLARLFFACSCPIPTNGTREIPLIKAPIASGMQHHHNSLYVVFFLTTMSTESPKRELEIQQEEYHDIKEYFGTIGLPDYFGRMEYAQPFVPSYRLFKGFTGRMSIISKTRMACLCHH